MSLPLPERGQPGPRILCDGYLVLLRGTPCEGDSLLCGPRIFLDKGSGEEWLLGRGSRARLRFVGDTLHPEHAILEHREDRFLLRNLDHFAATRVDGSELGPDECVVLAEGMVVELGAEVTLEFHRFSEFDRRADEESRNEAPGG